MTRTTTFALIAALVAAPMALDTESAQAASTPPGPDRLGICLDADQEREPICIKEITLCPGESGATPCGIDVDLCEPVEICDGYDPCAGRSACNIVDRCLPSSDGAHRTGLCYNPDACGLAAAVCNIIADCTRSASFASYRITDGRNTCVGYVDPCADHDVCQTYERCAEDQECERDLRELLRCLGTGIRDFLVRDADHRDSDKDGLSDYVETEYLRTNPCVPDTDMDGVGDGIDGTPDLDAPVPVHVEFTAIDQIDTANGCDVNGNWDPYFTTLELQIPVVGAAAPTLQLAGWIETAYVRERPNQNPNPVFVTAEGNHASAEGNTVTFRIEPNMKYWDVGGNLDLYMDAGFLLVDNDEKYDDTMDFTSGLSNSILSGGTTSLQFLSERAEDPRSNKHGGERNCQARITVHVDTPTATFEVLTTANAALHNDPQEYEFVSCNHPLMYDCGKRGYDSSRSLDPPEVPTANSPLDWGDDPDERY